MIDFFKLPSKAAVGRVIPKNAFDKYTNTKLKRQFIDDIKRITWTHKISADTVNLEGKDIQEIQVFRVELKKKADISSALEIINKAIPYHIVFWVEYGHEASISTASKHAHPTNDDIAIVDWTFFSAWFNRDSSNYQLNLKVSLDAVFKDLCVQITGKPALKKKSLESIIANQQEISQLKKEISKIQLGISKGKQFNKKVELNIRLKELQKKLKVLIEN